MFTGIVEEIGRVRSVRELGRGREFEIAARRVLDGLKPEDSVAISGPCLTVTALLGEGFRVQAVGETLAKTGLGTLRAGSEVHLERALAVGSRLGGHFVQGHVDCVGRVVERRPADPGERLTVAVPAAFSRYLGRTGSVALDGVSLTIAAEAEAAGGEARFAVALIPWTLEHTLLGRLRPGDGLNVEFDCLAKMVERLLAGGTPPAGGLSAERLRELGW
jgi:riboflavin synthase